MDTRLGRGISIGYIQVFENESAAKAAYEKEMLRTHYIGGQVTYLFVKAYTEKGAAKNAMTGSGEFSARFEQTQEAARIAQQERDKAEHG